MNQPNPWILFMGGISLLTLTGAVGGIPAPTWARYAGMAVCALLGLTSMGLGLARYFQKKPERQKYVPKKKRAQLDKTP
jgi:hypothetical protein